MNRTTTAVILLLAICSACSGETKGSQTASGTTTAGAGRTQGARAFDACALLLKADVDATFAPRTFTLDPASQPDIAGTATLASVSTCTFVSAGASVRDMMTVGLLARRSPSDASGVTVATAKVGAAQLKATPVDLPGLGDAAYWINLGSANRPSIQVNVFKGPRVWLIFSASAAGLDANATVEHLAKIAEAALGRL